MKAEQTIRLWVEGARPKTIPAAIVPVLVGTASSAGSGFILYRFFLALLVSIALQIGVNYANDYSDGIRGTDEDRIGPRRLVGSELIPFWKVKWASFVSFSVAAIAGLILAITINFWIVAIGLAAILAAWFYTGGSNPYGYLGFGEVSVFVFFGLVATVGSAFVQSEKIELLPILCGIGVGLVATGLLVVNNLRDIGTDRDAGKKTLAVRIGEQKTRFLYAFLMIGTVSVYALIGVIYCYPALIFLIVCPMAVQLAYQIYVKADSADLIKVLEMTAKFHLVSGSLFALGLMVGV